MLGADLISTIRRALHPILFKTELPKTPKRILVCNGAHMGDMVISSAVIQSIQDAYPEAELGVLTGSWAKPVLESTTIQTKWVHILDHWKLNRGPSTAFRKYWNYCKQYEVLRSEISELNYDLAIDLYPYFPNSIPLLFAAKIPVRVGYSSGGFHPLLSHSIDWLPSEKRIVDYQMELAKLALPKINTSHRSPALKSSSAPLSDPYIVLHPSSGASGKSWDPAQWTQIIDAFFDYPIIITGHGDADMAIAKKLVDRRPQVINQVNKLSWAQFLATIEHAKVLIAVETVAGHVASAFNTPSISLYDGRSQTSLWAPNHEESVLFSPIDQLQADVVIESAKKKLSPRHTQTEQVRPDDYIDGDLEIPL